MQTKSQSIVRPTEIHELMNYSADGYFKANRYGGLIEANHSLTAMLGYDFDDVSTQPDFFQSLFADHYDLIQLVHKMGSHKVVTQEPTRLKRFDGTVFNARLICRLAGDDNIIEGLVSDLTGSQAATDHLMHLHRLHSLGTMAASMAHDINNMLTVIQGNTDMLRLHELNPDDRLLTERIISACHKASTLTRHILAYSRKQDSQKQNISLNVVVDSVITMLESLFSKNIGIVVNLRPDLDLTYVDPAQIEQMIVNMCTNARDAMPQGGTITISTEHAELDLERLATHPDAREGKYVVMSVSDTGMGMSDEVKRKVMQPFYSTKAIGKGTGLGLYMASTIAKQHSGFMTIDSQPGSGTTINFFIPTTDSLKEGE